MKIIETETPLTNQDLTSILAVGSFTAPRAMTVTAQVEVSGLTNTDAFLTWTLGKTSSADAKIFNQAIAVPKDSATSTAEGLAAGILSVSLQTGEKAVISVLSSNASDSSGVGVSAWWYDASSVNVVEVSDDSTAANNLELDYDGTGYAKANSTIGTATAVTNEVTADAVKISGSAAAANNVESVYLGTGHTDGVKLAAERLLLSNDSATEAALEMVNVNANGTAMLADGGDIGVANNGGDIGVYNDGGDIGVYNYGGDIGVYNDGGDFGVHNDGGNIGVRNYGVNTGVYNYGVNTGVYNDGAVYYDKAPTGTLQTVDVAAISGDTTAANALELQYNGTGLSGDPYPATQAQIGNIASGSAAISTIATSVVITTGSETGDYEDTWQLDETYHIVLDAGDVTEFYYEFNVGSTGVPTTILWNGYAQGNNDTFLIKAWNWSTSTWQQIETIIGTAGTTRREQTWQLLASHVGTGTDAGKVRVQATSADGAAFATDRILCNYAVVSSPTGYANGAIWVDTVNGTAGAVDNVNGVADLPVDNWADALSLSTSTGLIRFEIAQGSSIAFAATTNGLTMHGLDWNLDLNGQLVYSMVITGAIIEGVASGNTNKSILTDCQLLETSLPRVEAIHCSIVGPITCVEIGSYIFDGCFSAIAGQAAPVFDLGAAIGSQGINFRHYSGGIDIHNLGASGTDSMSLEGWGQYILDSTCVGGGISVRGSFQKTDNSSGLVTITDSANYANHVVQAGVAQEDSGLYVNQIMLSSAASSVDGAYDPAMIMIVHGTGAGQSRMILQYEGATRTATVDRNWKVAPDATSEYHVMANPGREHVNEGLAQSGSSNTITLNTLASSANDAYVGQLVFIRSGTGEDQVRAITGYVGSTKVATVSIAWAVNPNATSGYVILPFEAAGEANVSSGTTVRRLKKSMEIAQGAIISKLDEDSGGDTQIYNEDGTAIIATVPQPTQDARDAGTIT